MRWICYLFGHRYIDTGKVIKLSRIEKSEIGKCSRCDETATTAEMTLAEWSGMISRRCAAEGKASVERFRAARIENERAPEEEASDAN